MAAQTKRILVPRLDRRFDEPVIDVAILESFQKLGMIAPLKNKHKLLEVSTFVMLPTGSGKSLCYASLLYIFESLRRSAGEKDAHHSMWLLSVLLARSCKTYAIITFR